MRTIFAEYNPKRNSIDVYTSVGYMLRIDCWEAEKDLKTTSGSDCALNALAIDDPLEYARLWAMRTGWKLYRCCRMEKSAGVNFWKDLKLPSQLYPII